MKMYIDPLKKDVLDRYLGMQDLTQSSEPHAVKHTAKPIPGEEVTLPGERGDALAKKVEDAGEIEIADAIWNELMAFVEA